MSAHVPRWRRWVRPSARQIQEEVDQEIRFHLETRVAELEQQGYTSEAAWREALRRFGDPGATRAALVAVDERRERTFQRREWLREAWRDAVIGWRLLRARPAFAAAAIATLGVGIGASTAIFSAADHVLLRALPYDEPERAVTLWEIERDEGGRNQEVSPGNFLDWRERATSFVALGLAEPSGFDLTGDGPPESLPAWRITEGFLEALGASPILGRTFLPEEYRTGSQRVVLLSHGFWRRRFGGDPSILSRVIRLDDGPVTVVGVLPPWLDYPEPADVWTPKAFRPDELVDRQSAYMSAVGRLRAGVTLTQAQQELDRIAADLVVGRPAANRDLGVRLLPLEESIRGALRTPMLVLLGAVGLMLLVACANVATLLLARGAEREAEFGLRAALGAGRVRLVRQLSAESLVLAAAGGSLGVVVAWAGMQALARVIPPELARLGAITVDARLLAFGAALSLSTAALFGLAPALRFSRGDLHTALIGAGRGSVLTRERAALSRALIAGELALAIVLLTGAGLLGRSFATLIANDLGFVPEGRVALQMFLWDRNPSPGQINQRIAEITERFRRVAGVEEVAVVSALPFHPHQISAQSALRIEGQPETEAGEPARVFTTLASPGYFRVMGIGLREGRAFTEADRAGAPLVAVVNQALARQFFAGDDPVGKRITFGVMGPPQTREIVGVVSDVRPTAFDSDARPEAFVPFAQSENGSVTFVVRASVDPANLVPTLSAEVWQIDPEQTIYHAATVPSLISATLAARRFTLSLVAVFSVVALLLAVLGVHGLVSFVTVQRHREIGVRLALGAERRDVVGMMLRQGLATAAPGIVAGALGALLLTRSLTGLLYGVRPFDLPTYLLVTGFMLALATLATYLPARKAAATSPVEALRAG